MTTARGMRARDAVVINLQEPSSMSVALRGAASQHAAEGGGRTCWPTPRSQPRLKGQRACTQ
eukprot:scaffold897_cov402-Prasinococcus_capsulatus_cf.AAC.53